MKEILASLSKNGDGKNNKKQSTCVHPAFLNKNLCAVCKKSVNKSSTLPFGYIFRDLSLTVDAIQRLRDLDLNQLLQRKRLRLVLDLDQTLIHAIDTNKINVKKKKNNKSDVYEILKGATSVKLRPGARDFLNKATQLFDLTIYTMAVEPYAKQIAKILESDSVRFSSVISREYSAKVDGKSLDIVLSHQRLTLIVDDLEVVWATRDRGNVIKIQPYTFFQKGVVDSPPDYDDQELERVWTILKNVHTNFFDKNNQNYLASKDVRQLLRNN